jgi:hypothetical protein
MSKLKTLSIDNDASNSTSHTNDNDGGYSLLTGDKVTLSMSGYCHLNISSSTTNVNDGIQSYLNMESVPEAAKNASKPENTQRTANCGNSSNTKIVKLSSSDITLVSMQPEDHDFARTLRDVESNDNSTYCTLADEQPDTNDYSAVNIEKSSKT